MPFEGCDVHVIFGASDESFAYRQELNRDLLNESHSTMTVALYSEICSPFAVHTV